MPCRFGIPPLGAPFADSGFLSMAPVSRCAGVYAGGLDPYLIDGLVISRVGAGYHARSHSLWLDWRHLGHAIFREDRISAAAGMGMLGGRLRVVARASAERRAASGFAAERVFALSLAAYGWFRGSLGLGAEAYLGDRARGIEDESSISLAVRGDPVSASVDRTVTGWRAGDTNLAVAVRLSGGVALLAGYRSMANEISSGIAVEAGPFDFDLFWSQNPALGSTFAAGLGRLWKW